MIVGIDLHRGKRGTVSNFEKLLTVPEFFPSAFLELWPLWLPVAAIALLYRFRFQILNIEK
jgi:hypothetical protein